MADRKHMPFAPRVAIVTGAASGIGFALARELITRAALGLGEQEAQVFR